MNDQAKFNFHKIGDLIDEINKLLDKSLKQYGEGDLNEDVIVDITEMIEKAYKEQLKLLGVAINKEP